MKLHFITSLSKDYWYSTAKKCVGNWNLPGELTVYVDQELGELNWLSEVPGTKRLLKVPDLKIDEFSSTAKIRKFWGKTVAQIVGVRNRENEERIIWLDSDIEQTGPINPELFNFGFDTPVATMNSDDGDDCWESGVVIFNEAHGKLGVFMKAYERAWNDEETLGSLWKPYDAQVLGHVASHKGFMNLCENKCRNENALENTRYRNCLKHWINKDNKALLAQK